MENTIYIQKNQMISPNSDYRFVIEAKSIRYNDEKSLQDKIDDLVNAIEEKEHN